MARIQDVESIIEKNMATWLLTLSSLGYPSVRAKIFRAINNTYSNVYGREAGEEGVKPVAEIDALISGDDFFPADSNSSGTFSEGWLYTSNKSIQVRDRVEIIREDGSTRRYEVTAVHRIGSTRSVFPKYRIAALGD